MSILTAMTQPQQVTLAELSAHLAELIEDVHRQGTRVTITRDSEPVAVILSAVELDSLDETLGVLGDGEAMASVRQARHELADAEVLTKDALLERLHSGH